MESHVKEAQAGLQCHSQPGKKPGAEHMPCSKGSVSEGMEISPATISEMQAVGLL